METLGTMISRISSKKPDISHGGIQNQQEDFEKVGNGFQS